MLSYPPTKTWSRLQVFLSLIIIFAHHRPGMSRASTSIQSANAKLSPSEQITEIVDDFEVPSADVGRYEVLICTPTHAQAFPTLPDDTIRKRRVLRVQNPLGTEYITTYGDDIVQTERVGDNGQPVTTPRSFAVDEAGFSLRAKHPMTFKLHSASHEDRLLADLGTGEELSVWRMPSGALKRETGAKGERYTYDIGTLGPDDQAGYARCSDDTLRDNCSGM